MDVKRAGPGLSLDWVPNALTIARLAIGLVYLFLPIAWRWPMFLVAAATEFFDGFLARILRATSLFGQKLDPVADKVFVLAVLFSLVANGVLPVVWLLPVAARDVAVLIGTLTVGLVRGHALIDQLTPRLLGKLATTAQLVLLGWGVWFGALPLWLLIVTSALSIAAGIDYVGRFRSTSNSPVRPTSPCDS
jgi:phosphatidylglycerophosphate synthase